MATIAVIDAGGRGAALVQAYSKSQKVDKILAIPGNDYMQENSEKPVITYPHIQTTNIKEIIEICKKEKVSFVDVAQDNALAVGLVDALQKDGFVVFGATRAQSELEWNKAFARKFMTTYSIPQPEYAIFDSVEKGIAYLQKQSEQEWFVKAAGLCEGKGALPAHNNAEAEERIIELQKFGDAGKTYLLEKWVKSTDGSIAEEFSAFALSDGQSWQLVGFAQDHKRALDGDKGENTGGMGVSTPPLVVTENIKKQTLEIFSKTFEGMKKEGRSYSGVLYLGGLLVGGKVYVVEYNARWGDPEVEVILPGIKNDFYEISLAIVEKKLDSIHITTDGKARVAVAITAKGYPQDYSFVKGKEILGLEKVQDVLIYGAGIKKKESDSELKIHDARYVVNGGRVLYVIGDGKDVSQAREKVYKAVKHILIEGDNMHYRTDIGWRDMQRISK